MFRLCLALGRAHPDYLLAELDSRQIAEWIAYQQVEPWGEERDDVRAALIASTAHNLMAKRPAKIGDFMLKFQPKEAPSQDELAAKLKRVFGAVTESMTKRGKK